MCNQCVMDTTDPEIFNNKGICSHCINFEQFTKKSIPKINERKLLNIMIEEIKKEGLKRL